MSTGRRPSASSPYPVRVMSSIKPADYPSPSGSKSKGKSSPQKRDDDDPFVDNSRCDLDCLTNSPQEERVALPSPWHDAERQPLLGTTEERSPAVKWSLVMGIVLAMVVGGVIVFGVTRMHSEDWDPAVQNGW